MDITDSYSGFETEEVWKKLVHYKTLEDRVMELRRLAELNFTGDKDVEAGIAEIERELKETKVWLELDFGVVRGD